MLVGAAGLPLLPVARAGSEATSKQTASPIPADPGDPTQCDYWRYCGINGNLCSCCGGQVNACPPGTEMSPITWIGTCENPADKRRYIISYNDCCGFKNTCNRCACMRNEGDTPPYRPSTNNDINWCLGTSSNVYHCSTAVLLGVAFEENIRAMQEQVSSRDDSE
jgi:methylamine dehydrogenase light chain